MMNDKKIAFIYCVNNRDLYEESVRYVKSLHVPDGYEIEFIAIEGAQSITSGYNQAMKQTDAKYKVYLHQDVFIVNKSFIYDILSLFERYPKLGLLGVAGSKYIPSSGVWWETDLKYGKVYDSISNILKLNQFNEVREDYESVEAVDGLIIITQYDLPWRDDLFKGWHFYDVSQCREFINAGYEVGIPKQELPWCVHDCGICDVGPSFQEARWQFLSEYFPKFNGFKNTIEFNRSRFDVFYQAFKNTKVDDISSINRKIIQAKMAATIAWYAHPGFYVSPELENGLLEIAKKTVDLKPKEKIELPMGNKGYKKILHVMTAAYRTGGHTRAVERWILNRLDKNEHHSVIILEQDAPDIPNMLYEVSETSGGKCIVLNDNLSYLEKVLMLRDISLSWADLVVLHTHPDDPIPSIAYGINYGPPIVLYNHADHAFWLGANISDLVIDGRGIGFQISKERRLARGSHLIPLPLVASRQFENKNEIRRKFNIPDEMVILLTIADSYKFTPYTGLNYFETLSKILKKSRNVLLIIIGMDEKHPLAQKAKSLMNHNICFLGTFSNIEDFYKLADIYIESFPIGSPTAALDAAMRGIPVVHSLNNSSPLFTVEIFGETDKGFANENEYINYVVELINSKDERCLLGEIQRKAVLKKHIGEMWNKRVDSLFSVVPNRHSVKLLNTTKNINQIESHDVVWSRVQFLSNYSEVLNIKLNSLQRKMLSY
ncbi:glycosyltransferase [Anoxybacillus sp. PDR2]|uniref:glycosyltransferase n=1 Tax=Anoxybacillus sp. PDR2 TaxID=1636720 RepID=UPI001317C6F0|nr:glycosyltransferase [Anoxybacillus sp. PDR2]QHC05394.1 glycosyltransferase [Anoxybacillus sp. PDR2]